MTRARQIVLYGTGTVADLVRYYLAQETSYQIVACTVDATHLQRAAHRGVPVVSFEEVTRHYPPEEFAMFVAVGYSRMNGLRAERYAAARKLGYELITHVSPRASTWPDLQVGDNCIIMDGVHVQPFARIGSDCIIWSGSHIGHGAVIGDHAYIAATAAVSGLAQVGERSFLGTGSIVRDGVSVGQRSLVGAGAVVNADIADGAILAAPAARILPGHSEQLPRF